MAGIKALRKIQLATEAVAGTDLPCTTIWRGMGTLEDTREVVFVEEDVGLLGRTNRTYVSKLGSALPLEPIEATFEQLPYILNCGVERQAGVQDGAGTDYIRQHDFSTGAQNTFDTLTVECGDDAGVEESHYMYVDEFEISGEAGASLMMSASLLGRTVEPAAFTAGLSVPAVEEILFGKGKLYIDDTWAGLGGTLKSNTLIQMSVKVKTGRLAVFTDGGQLYFSFTKQIKPEIELQLTFEHDATSIAEKAKWRSEALRAIKIIFEGSAVATPGTTYSYKTLIIALPVVWKKFDKIGEKDGNDIVTGTAYGVIDTTPNPDTQGYITVVNELATLP